MSTNCFHMEFGFEKTGGLGPGVMSTVHLCEKLL